MTPTMTALVVEHLVTGLLIFGAFFLAIGPDARLQTLASSIPSTLRLLVGVAGAYIVGVIFAHIAARLYEPIESRVYLRVLRDTSAYPSDILWESLFAWHFELRRTKKSPEITDEDGERIFSLMRYSLLSDPGLKDRITYYQTMIRICRNNIVPLALAAVAFFIRLLLQKPSDCLLFVLGVAALGLSIVCCFAAVGYSEWLGYATLRGFLALSAKTSIGKAEGPPIGKGHKEK